VSTIDDALAVLLSADLEPIVEMVVYRRGDRYVAHAIDGRVEFIRRDHGTEWLFDDVLVDGRNPIGVQSADRFTGLDDEEGHRYPHRSINAYPHAHEQIAQLFDSPHAPDLVVLHTAAHHWADQGGHIGEHGSIDVVQSRAPFVIAGRGIRRMGTIAGSIRLTDVAPTIAALLGLTVTDGVGLNGTAHAGALLGRQDGVVIADLLDPDNHPDHVIGFLLDGANANVLYDAIRRGDLPHLGRLAAMGTTLQNGATCSLPTVTLANHTTVMTGVHPGHHGVLHNAWWDRRLGRQIITNDPAQWATAMENLVPGVETLHEAIRRNDPTAFTVSINEPCDRGASFSTFDLIRRGVRMEFPKVPEHLPHATERFVRPVKDYGWYTCVDHHGMQQAVGILRGRYLGTDYPVLPRYLWMNLTLTDSAFHEGGPHSEIARASLADSDGRIGEVLAALDDRAVFDRCAFYVVADHGMEQSDPACTGDWDVALRDAGVDFRDEAYGFIYLDPMSQTRAV
jgi:hypothetical protein